MEASGLLNILCKLQKKYEGNVYVKAVVADDDSTMRAVVRHRDTAVTKKGRLPEVIPETSWLVDPSHRTKVVAGKVYALAAL